MQTGKWSLDKYEKWTNGYTSFLNSHICSSYLVKDKILMELGLDLYLFNILTVTEEGWKDLHSGPQHLSLKTTHASWGSSNVNWNQAP